MTAGRVTDGGDAAGVQATRESRNGAFDLAEVVHDLAEIVGA
ncbi:hypothetical protein AB0J14_27770 [Micromonospora arborensis]